MSHPPTPPSQEAAPPAGRRFLTLDQVAEELAVSRSPVPRVVRKRSLIALRIGGQGVWRVERSRLEAYITALYQAADKTDPPEQRVADPADKLADQDDGPGEPRAS